MRSAACFTLLLLLQQTNGCNPDQPKPAAEPKSRPPIHRFEPLAATGQQGVALDTVSGQWCKTWEWAYKNDSYTGSLDTLPSCLTIFKAIPSEGNDYGFVANPPTK